jgi:hypothetical protein
MIRFALPLLLALPLAACGGSGDGTTLTINAQDDQGGVRITADGNGHAAIDAGGFKGSIKLPSIKLDAADFDIDGMTLYPGSKISNFNVDASEKAGQDKGLVRVDFESPAAIATVREWFESEMAKSGLKVQASGQGFAGTTRQGDTVKLELAPGSGDRTVGKLSITD